MWRSFLEGRWYYGRVEKDQVVFPNCRVCSYSVSLDEKSTWTLTDVDMHRVFVK
jgi:hypothetical protein